MVADCEVGGEGHFEGAVEERVDGRVVGIGGEDVAYKHSNCEVLLGLQFGQFLEGWLELAIDAAEDDAVKRESAQPLGL